MNASKIAMRLLGISVTILVVILIVYGLYQLGLSSYSYGYRIFTEPPVSSGDGKERPVHVKNSMGASDIGELLEENGLIRDKWLFVLQLKLSEYNGKIAPGHYLLSPSMTAQEMMKIMSGEEEEDTGEEGAQGGP